MEALAACQIVTQSAVRFHPLYRRIASNSAAAARAWWVGCDGALREFAHCVRDRRTARTDQRRMRVRLFPVRIGHDVITPAEMAAAAEIDDVRRNRGCISRATDAGDGVIRSARRGTGAR